MLRQITATRYPQLSFVQQVLQRRSYQSKKGVYGYRPLPKRVYRVSDEVLQSRNAQGNVYRWVEAYRKHGHKLASVNPISIRDQQSTIDELNPQFYGLAPEQTVQPQGLISGPQLTVGGAKTVARLAQLLEEIYCGDTISAEFHYIESLEEREWLAHHFERLVAGHQQQDAEFTISNDARRQIAELLIKSQTWDNFMAIRFASVKRYGGEGAESLLAFYWQLLRSAVQVDISDLVVAMPHRGRLPLQTVMLNMRPAKIFHKLSGESEFPDDAQAMSDTLSHFHSSEDLEVEGKKIHISLLRNPSHLEAVNPVSMGKTRSKQQTLRDGAFSADPITPFGTTVLNVIIHGDAAFAGQGVNQECLNMAYVPHFEVGGSVHLIVNNQVGFTTPGERGRSTDYATDLAKTIQAPVFHVNGDNPEMVTLITHLAMQYQREFRKDVFIDMNCFRRWGHNEMDDPTFTNPSVYQIIHNRKTVPDLYVEKLIQLSVLSNEEAKAMRQSYWDYLDSELSQAKSYRPEANYFKKQWTGLTSATETITVWDTGLDYQLLNYIGHQSVYHPPDFNVHPHLLKTHIEGRRKKLDNGEKIDWSTAEALAIGSLMYQGHHIRISGEDVGRGTFSHRHIMLVDQKTNEMYIPLNSMKGGHGGKLEIAHSILSEEAVLGYEYGMAIDDPQKLIIWEAQFGDFANGAQIMIDNFIITGETKWMDSNGLVILLPHGYDGAASEHSSCRIERFLQLCDSKETTPDGDNVNVNIVNPTTSAQYFHLLRRQLLRNFRKPLIVVAPKIMLRHPAATSTHVDFQSGTHFRNVLGDVTVNADQVRKVILCSGKHFFVLDEARRTKGINDIALIRLESLCPFPAYELQEELAKYKQAKSFVWSQEEHRNMGAWNFVRPRFECLIGKQLNYVGRSEAATTATGIGKVHKREADEIVANSLN
ncbi:probable 2-oxoglutarate dehydrogenase E1 component DHKTD1 homolog, mitochondrial isoform X2 [Rhagoletis pomonella]|uniref:probable 2-oxoglutarate dehydrogenase E1 component DHKTD1 homolog, mitochondrial isoform X2 n=1 Tax=Rhagoletis pomonella TaxID=28610 RepID=UPI0017876DC3|nr:probable 2-oxoglutarate dehydrogenase E1 component DHKTD1 homolog, mitochondrial isoform X2 [Rhagoletis pomonella]